jgi:hypothetical protein
MIYRLRRMAARLLYDAIMMRVFAGLLLSTVALLARTQQPQAAEELNVNARYTVEGVEVSGASESRFSKTLRDDLHRLVGAKLNPEIIDDLARRIRLELHVRSVYRRVVKGAAPENVRVVFEVAHRKAEFDVSVPRFVYQSGQGWSGGVEGSLHATQNTLALGLVSDGDELVERFTGFSARYENARLATDRVHFRFQFSSFHEQWNPSTVSALAQDPTPSVPGIYRNRQQFEPSLSFAVAKPLTLSIGTDFERFQTEFPAARTEAANAAIITLRYRRRLESSGPYQQDIDAGYSLRAAAKALDSDFSYTRHRWDVRYLLSWGRHHITERFLAGRITGRAPLYERYSLGSSSLLRGWNKFDLDPLGGDKVAHNSVEYRCGMAEVFYDTGAVWSQGERPSVKHSLGVGLRRGVFSAAVAVPMRNGHFTPALIVGMNY